MDILSFLLGRITADGSGGGGSANLGTLLITENGQYDAADEGYDGYSEVSAEIPASAVDTGTKNITSNGDNQDVIGYAAVNVNVPNTYAAGDEGKVVSDGALVAQTAHADVTPGTSDQTIDTTLNDSIKVIGDADLVAGNIKKDVNIFGVTGSYEGSGGSAGYKTGTFTPASRVAAITFDTGLTTIHGILIVPTEESPLKSEGRTLYAFISAPDVYGKSLLLPSNSAGSSAQSWYRMNSNNFTQSGTEVTVTGWNTGNYGYFETVSYTWYAW